MEMRTCSHLHEKLEKCKRNLGDLNDNFSPRLPGSDDPIIWPSDQQQGFDLEEVFLPLWEQKDKQDVKMLQETLSCIS